MQDNESSTNLGKISQEVQEKSAESSLITLERSQKLDLLIHLISNLTQSLVICGPKGIGKTILLNELKVRKQEQWPIFTIDVSSSLSFESFQDQLLNCLKQNYDEYKNHDVLSILSALDKLNQKIVVIIDDSGQLVPGLIDTIVQYASSYCCLRIVFSLTHDELHIINSSDKAIDECHFIDIPPLTEHQCGIFLQNLSAKPGAIISFEAINSRLIAKLYQKTHGIPGRIVSELPSLSNYNAVSEYKWGGTVLISAVIALGIGIIIYDEPDSKVYKDESTSPIVLEKSEVVEISSPVVYLVDKSENKAGEIENQNVDEETDVFSVPLSSYAKKVDRNSSVVDDEKSDSEKKPQLEKKLKAKFDTQVSNLDNRTVEKLKKNKLAVDRARLVSEKAKDSSATILKSIQTKKKTTEIIEKIDKNAKKKIKPKVDVIAEVIAGSPLEKQRIKTEQKKSEKVESKVKSNEKKIKAKEDVIDETVDRSAQEKQSIKSKNKKPEKVEKEEKANKNTINTKSDLTIESDDRQWILKQPKINYTIQLMVLSKHKSVVDFFKKNKSLKENLKFFQLSKLNRKKYVIIYGSFNSISKASKEMNLLPVQYRKSWVRSYKILQKEIKK